MSYIQWKWCDFYFIFPLGWSLTNESKRNPFPTQQLLVRVFFPLFVLRLSFWAPSRGKLWIFVLITANMINSVGHDEHNLSVFLSPAIHDVLQFISRDSYWPRDTLLRSVQALEWQKLMTSSLSVSKKVLYNNIFNVLISNNQKMTDHIHNVVLKIKERQK